MDTVEIKFEDPTPNASAGMNATAMAAERRLVATALREQHPGKWAIISEGHATIKSAGVVRRRLLKQPTWEGFEMTSRKATDGNGHVIYARYPAPVADQASEGTDEPAHEAAA